MDRFSQNYLKINCLYFPHACSVLRTTFLSRWKLTKGKDWDKSKTSDKNLITNSMNELYKKSFYIKQFDSHLANTDEWGLKTFTRILENVNLKDTLSADLKRRENNMITTLLTLHIQVSCNPQYSVTDNEFLNICKKMDDILLHFGSSPITLRKFKTADIYSTLKDVETNEKLAGVKTPIKVDDMKRTANKFYMEGDYINAIKFYCEALDFENLSKIDRSVLYSNRSAATLAAANARPNSRAVDLSLEIYDIIFPYTKQQELDVIIIYEMKKSAKNDAKKSVLLRPAWFRGHYRLACAYQSLRKHQDALRHFNIAIKLNPTIQEMNDARDGCKKIALRDYRSTESLSCIHKFDKLLKECEMKISKSNTFWEMCTSYPFDVQQLDRFAVKGSKTANRLKEACKYYAKALVYLNSEGDVANTNFVNELSKCLKIEPITAHFNKKDKKLASDVIASMLRRQDINKLSDLDKNLRICMVYMLLPEFNLEFIDESAAKYPDEEYFQELYCIQVACFGEHQEDALEQIEMALKSFPNNSKLQYAKADVLRRMYDYPKRSIEAFQCFLQLVPEDDRFVPNVCYRIAFLFACQMFMFGEKKLIVDVKKYLKLGEEREQMQLPFFSLQEITVKSALYIIIQTLSKQI